jgi:flagellar hook protein FlgE
MSLIGTLNSGVSAIGTFSQSIQVISDNIANVNTTGFKSSRTSYSDGFSNLLQQATPSVGTGAGANAAIQIGSGVQLSAITADNTQGTLTSTGSNSDLGITGNGFFRIRDVVNNVDYVSRAGDFRLDEQGYLVNDRRFRVQGASDGGASYVATSVGGTLTFTQTSTLPSAIGDLRVNFDIGIGSGLVNNTGGAFTDEQVAAAAPKLKSFTVDPFGNIVVGLTNGDTLIRGQVLLQNFTNPGALTREGNNLYSGFTPAGPVGGTNMTIANNSPGSNGLGRVQVGTLELSNVDLSRQFSDMIITQRSFQAGSRVITIADGLLEEVVNLKR